MNQTYRIFTDGSAIGNPGPGGWGAVLMQGKRRWELSGAFPWTTISEMELVAAIQALRSLPDRARVELHSDSEYLIYGMRVFVFHWQRQGWRNRRGNQLQHRELWSELIALNARLHIRWTGSKGITEIGIRAAPTAGVSSRSHSLGTTEGRGLMLAEVPHIVQKEKPNGFNCRSEARCLKLIWNSMDFWKRFRSRLSPKVSLRKIWWPDSNNSAKHMARRLTGLAASCA